jgi:Na+-translocating ferredoxin:NAD+ oxidoreductase RnfD subunit
LYIVIDLFSNLKMLGAYFVLGRFHVYTLYIVIDLFSSLKMLGAYFVLGRFPVNTKNNNINNKE